MKRISMVLVAFAAVLAFSAVAVSSASAGVLFETETGNFPVAFSGKSTTTAVLETTKSNKVECTETEAKGELGNMAPESGTKFAHLLLIVVLFKNCKNNILGGGPCENKGKGTKEIEVVSFPAHLGLTHKGTNLHVPAILLLPGRVLFNCTVLGVEGSVEVTGNVIGEIENPEIGKYKNSLSLSLKKNGTEKGVQEYKLFLLSLVPESEALMENEHLTSVLLGNSEESSQEGKITVSSASRNVALVEG